MMATFHDCYRRKLSPDQIQQIVDWREAGRSYGWIADQLGVSNSTVHYHCLKQGAVSPRQKLLPVPDKPVTFIGYDGKLCHRYTQADDRQLLKLEAQGKNYSEISRTIGRGVTSVRVRLMTLAQRDEILERAT